MRRGLHQTMRVLRLAVLGVLMGLTTLCFGLAVSAALETGEVMNQTRAEQPDFVVRTRLTAVPSPLTALQAPAWPTWTTEWTEPSPELTVEPKKRRSRRDAKVEPASSLVAPEDAIRMVLRRKRSAFEHCYEQALKKQAAFDGFVVLSVSLSANGRVTDAHVEEGTRRDAQVGACIVGQLRQLQLPALTEEADLLIPIRLQAKKQT